MPCTGEDTGFAEGKNLQQRTVSAFGEILVRIHADPKLCSRADMPDA